MDDVKILQQERIKIYKDVHENRIPKRVPVNIALDYGVIAEFAGLDLLEAQWKPEILESAADEICKKVYSDICVYGSPYRFASYYEILKSQSFVMGSNGFIQHPEVEGMLPEEYDYLIEKPLDCLYEKVIPRQYKALDLKNPVSMAIQLGKSVNVLNGEFMNMGGFVDNLVEKYGYYAPNMLEKGFTEAPFDFIADQLRGFKGISMDIRRMPEKVAEACEAIYPIVKKKGMPARASSCGSAGMPLHMPTFMREKDFAKYWWPSFKKLVDDYASSGVHTWLFCEDDWSRYLDYLYELPVDTTFRFEYGDAKKIKDKLGKKHIITGLFPMKYLKNHTKQECIDKTKEYIDILAPGGKYIFDFDKVPISLSDINIENLIAVTETVRDYGVYSNPGETAGMQFNKNDYVARPSRNIESKYYKTWDMYRKENPKISEFGRAKLEAAEDSIFNYMIELLL